jgi:hypothetical protein
MIHVDEVYTIDELKQRLQLESLDALCAVGLKIYELGECRFIVGGEFIGLIQRCGKSPPT